jgi:hypothetical protein
MENPMSDGVQYNLRGHAPFLLSSAVTQYYRLLGDHCRGNLASCVAPILELADTGSFSPEWNWCGWVKTYESSRGSLCDRVEWEIAMRGCPEQTPVWTAYGLTCHHFTVPVIIARYYGSCVGVGL